MNRAGKLRNLVLVLGDQLDEKSSAFDDFDLKTDAGWMAEVARESEKIWVPKPRIVIFLAAMRHFRDALLERGWRVFYRALSAKSAEWSGRTGQGATGEPFAAQLAWTIAPGAVHRRRTGKQSSSKLGRCATHAGAKRGKCPLRFGATAPRHARRKK
jgi:hypothetical protein